MQQHGVLAAPQSLLAKAQHTHGLLQLVPQRTTVCICINNSQQRLNPEPGASTLNPDLADDSPPRQHCASDTGTPHQSRHCPAGAQAAQQGAHVHRSECSVYSRVRHVGMMSHVVFQHCVQRCVQLLDCATQLNWSPAVLPSRFWREHNPSANCTTVSKSLHTTAAHRTFLNTHRQVFWVDDIQLCLKV